MKLFFELLTAKFPCRSYLKWPAAFLLALLVLRAKADTIVDHEPDPLPVVTMSVILPTGATSETASEKGVSALLSDIFESGTEKLTKQDYQEKLASFGADVQFGSSSTSSTWSLTFPLLSLENTQRLADLLHENWSSPRLNGETFDLARSKLVAALKGSLDSDFSLASATARRWLIAKHLGQTPLTVDVLETLSLRKVQDFLERELKNPQSLWVGVVGPQAARPHVEALLKTVFPAASRTLRYGVRKTPLASTRVEFKNPESPSVEVLIVDKPARTQGVTALVGLSSYQKLSAEQELFQRFGDHILVGSGFGSIFLDEIRTQRGLAYTVGGVGGDLLGQRLTGFASNPVMNRMDEALSVISSLWRKAYFEANAFQTLPEDAWKRSATSFRNSAILEQRSASERLSRRAQVLSGDSSWDYVDSNPDSWRFDRGGLGEFFLAQKNRVWVVSIVGPQETLRPLVEKHFPGQKIQMIPFRDSIRAATYNP